MAIRQRNPAIADILMGEVGGARPDGFDHGNSPFEASSVDFAGKSGRTVNAGPARWARPPPELPGAIPFT